LTIIRHTLPLPVALPSWAGNSYRTHREHSRLRPGDRPGRTRDLHARPVRPDHHSTGAVCTSFPRHQGRPHPGRSPGGYGLGLNWTAQTIPGPPATPRSESAPAVGEIDDHAHLLYLALDW